ncbi:MAG: elongation factor G [Ardenticatenaceae bacterium]|nr:elongation factor G [Ardenticatenaceae bacterium]MCB9003875.1 elongation factor G [Ardenticatenaceae bacterium]
MKEYKSENIRNIALVGHNGSGKTTFVERLLFNTKVTTRMGSVQSGTAAMDFEEEEVSRNSSVSLSIAPIEWNNIKVNTLDTPGFMDFIGEVNAALTVTDGALVFVEAVAGVEVGTEAVWQAAAEQNLPRMLLINKMDRENVRVARVMESINENLDGRVINIQLPIGEGTNFQGIIDLINMEARLGENAEKAPIPDDMADAAEEARMELIEAAAEGDDALIEKYFEEEDLSNEEIIAGLKAGMLAGDITPALYAAPDTGIAVAPLMEMLVKLIPNPTEKGEFSATDGQGESVSYPVADTSPLAAFIFKTREDNYGKTSYIRVFGGMLHSDTRVLAAELDEEVRVSSIQIITGKEQQSIAKLHAGDIGAVIKLGDAGTNDTLCENNNRIKLPAIKQPNPIASVSVHPVSQSDVAKLTQSLTRLVAEDPTLSWHTETATHETILSGMGTTHLDIAVKKAISKFGTHLSTSTPKIPYRETITKTSSAEYTHKKQTGGAGQYGRVFLRVESIDDNIDFEFDQEIFGGAISAPFIAATEKGCRQAAESGVLAGYPVVGVKAIVYDGKMHPVDSKEIAFQIAGREGFKKAVLGAGPVLLEPIYIVTVTVPADYMGDILGDMNSRRARVLGMDQEGTKSVVRAEVPLAEMQTYAQDMRSMTQGRGVFSMEFSGYGRVPNHMLQDVVAKLKAAEEEEK